MKHTSMPEIGPAMDNAFLHVFKKVESFLMSVADEIDCCEFPMCLITIVLPATTLDVV